MVNYPIVQPNNPSSCDRHQLVLYSLQKEQRSEDFHHIIKNLSPPPDITTISPAGSFKNIKIAIIGSGAAGLASAFELRKLGFDITIFEASKERIGGRIYTYYFDKNKNLYGELGPMRIPVSHETTWHYINLFHLNTRPFIQNNKNTFLYVRNTRVRNDPDGKNVMEKIYPKFPLYPWERNIPWQKLIEYGLETPLLSISPAIRREILQIKPIYDSLINYWGCLNIRQVLEKMGLSEGAIDLIGSLSPLDGDFYYNSYIETLQEIYPVNFSFLYEIIGGSSNLSSAFYRSLICINPSEYPTISPHLLGKITFKAGHWIRGMYLSSNNHVTLKYQNTCTNKMNEETFDYIICAIPFSSLRNIEINPSFTSRKMQAIREVDYSNAQKILFLCKNRFWEKGGPNERIIGGGSFTDLLISSIYYPSDHRDCSFTNYCSPDDPGVLLASYNYRQSAVRLGNMEEHKRVELAKRQIEKVHGLPMGYMDKIVIDYKMINWNHVPYFYGAFCYFMPEQKRIFSYSMTTPEYNNKIFFAGEHTSSSHGWMQGALHSGACAANALAKYCKYDHKPLF
ncbi:FAD-dependent oxidoreductase [Inediibacterium massiliense]|uniref:flavin monoamine oxidase family protein n=1 Tax=Inediibacterium massiliense TaxID=1658111 RepID=UPI0006B47F61|nr:FAD-dependent oxidoreductase [Inediibacterium massiliense]